MIRIRLGIVFLRSEQIRLERPVTMITERPITKAPFSCTVTASEEQIPRTRTEIGLPLKIGFRKVYLKSKFAISYSSTVLTDSTFFAR